MKLIILASVLILLLMIGNYPHKAEPDLQTTGMAMAVLTQLESPEKLISVTQNNYKTMTITLKSVADVKTTCAREHKKHRQTATLRTVKACAFWQKNTCLVVTAHYSTMQIIGQAVRHCFQDKPKRRH